MFSTNQEVRGTLPLRGALLLVAILFANPVASPAANGDCGQPTSSAAAPKSSDALTILRRSVGIATACDAKPCICDVNGSGTVSTTDALLTLKNAVGQPVVLACSCAVVHGDDFNDDSRDPARWGDDFPTGNGVLNETSHVLEYTCSAGTADDESLRPWAADAFPFVAGWEVQVDVTDLNSPTKNTQYSSIGIDVIDEKDGNNEFYAELYVSRTGGPPAIHGFYGELYKNSALVSYADTLEVGGTTGAVRIAFNAVTKAVTLSYDADASDGYTWVTFGSFGLAGSGGSDGNTDWGFSASDRFLAAVYGYSASTIVTAGQMHADNFRATGGVAP